MEPAHRAVLRRLRLELSGQLLVSDTIVPFLYQEEILTEAHVEDIERQPTDRQKSLKLLDVLPNRGPRAFDAFLRSLRDFSWLRDRLLRELQPAGPGPGDSGETGAGDVTGDCRWTGSRSRWGTMETESLNPQRDPNWEFKPPKRSKLGI